MWHKYNFFLCFKLILFTGLFQNNTIEERVSLLEIQVTDLEENVTDLDQDVNFLFDEQVIQDERLLTLEQTTDAINAELVSVDDELESEFLIQNDS